MAEYPPAAPDDDNEVGDASALKPSPLTERASDQTYAVDPASRQQLLDRGFKMLGAGQRGSAGINRQLEDATAGLLRGLQPLQDQINIPMLSAASALLAPTRTGRFTESLSAAGPALIGPLMQQRKEEQQRQMLGQQAAIQAARARQAEFLKQQELGTRLLVAGSRQGAQQKGDPLSIIERQLRAENLTQGTPEYSARAKELWEGVQADKRRPEPRSTAQSSYGKAVSDYNAGHMGGPPGSSEATAGWTAQMRELGFPDDELPAPPAVRPTGAPSAPGAPAPAPSVRSAPVAKPTSAALSIIPDLPFDPFGGMDMRTKARALATGRTAYGKLAEGWREQDAAAESQSRQIDRFLDLNKGTRATMSERAPYLGALTGGARAIVNPAIGEMNAISARMARLERTPGEGSTSDFDARQFLLAVLSYNKSYETNRNIGEFRKAAAQAESDKRDFQRAYFQRHQVLDGSDKAWRRYANANPILDPRKTDVAKDAVVINPNRWTWQQYFRAEAAQEELARRDQGE